MHDLWNDSQDPNLCLGMFALQAGFVDRETLLKSLQNWFLNRSRSLGTVLEESGAIAPEQHAALRAWVEQCCVPAGAAPPPPSTATPAAAPSLTTPPLPASLRYRVENAIAHGGLGKVSLARDEVLGRDVALKEILEPYAEDDRKRQRFIREAQITGRLEHPGIVPVYDMGEDGRGRPFYAMRRIDGITLRNAVDCYHGGEHPPMSHCVDFRSLIMHFVSICKTVAYAHSRGVVHRDLKPENIMLGPYGEALLLDWGLARAEGHVDEISGVTDREEEGSERLTRDGAAIGTPAFMSPEQAAGQLDRVGPASDVYSLGATLYQILTGRPPVQGGKLPEVLERVRHHDFPPPRQLKPSIPPALEAICLKAMALEPAARYSSPLALAMDVELWLADQPITAYRAPWPTRFRHWARMHRGTAQMLAAGILVALLLTVLGLLALLRHG